MSTVKEAVEVTQGKVLEYLKNPTKGAMFVDILPMCGLRRGEFVEGVSEYRILDRALQELRKAGKIEFDVKGWTLKKKVR
jgi:hypothetical protein